MGSERRNIGTVAVTAGNAGGAPAGSTPDGSAKFAPGAQATLFAATPRNECVFSPCRRYRYSLIRRLGAGEGACLWVLANPSVADEFRLDPTLRRCADYTERWGYAEMRVANVRALVETDSAKVPDDDVLAAGPDNLRHVALLTEGAGLVVCGWGKLGGKLGVAMRDYLDRYCVHVPHALKLNGDGSPQHPLYLSKTLRPFPMVEAR